MNRRDFISQASGMVAAPLCRPAFAQREVPVVGVLVMNPPDVARARLEAVRQGLKDAGLAEGSDFTLTLRFADGVFDRLPGLAREIADLRPKVVIGGGNGADVWHHDFPDTPMVFTGYATDPIKEGFGSSFAHPGGMVTGNVMNAQGGEEALAGKRLGYLKEVAPGVARVGFLGTRISGAAQSELRGLNAVADRFGCQIRDYMLETIDQVEAVVAACQREGMDALYVSGAPLLSNNKGKVMPHLLASNKPTISTYVERGRAGVLLSYATDLLDGFRRAGLSAGKILKGAKPGDLPIEQATRFNLVLNLATAKRLGIVFPPTLVTQADELIE